tara:strand:+ start:4707 stop:4850 length:144 start_codon:yes stop_codon:yes gene_type:complete
MESAYQLKIVHVIDTQRKADLDFFIGAVKTTLRYCAIALLRYCAIAS